MLRYQVIEAEAWHVNHKQALLPVRGQKQKQHIVVWIHQPTDVVQRALQVAGIREWRVS